MITVFLMMRIKKLFTAKFNYMHVVKKSDIKLLRHKIVSVCVCCWIHLKKVCGNKKLFRLIIVNHPITFPLSHFSPNTFHICL